MLTISQFADKVGKSRQRIHQLMREGCITPKPIKVGSYYLVEENAKLTTDKDKRKVNGSGNTATVKRRSK